MDISLAKGWRLPFFGEGGRIEYRFEAFNLFNATHLANPVTGLTNPNFGKITGTDGDPRILQMALKVGLVTAGSEVCCPAGFCLASAFAPLLRGRRKRR